MARPDGIPVLDALDIVPHAVAIDQARARCLRDADHAAVDMLGHAGDHELWRRAEPLRPVLPDQLMIAADAAGRHDHRLRLQSELADHVARRALATLDIIGGKHGAADAIHRAVGDGERIDAMATPEDQPAALHRLARAAFERLDDPWTGAPGDVEARHRIAVAHRVIAAAFGPADHGEDAMAHRPQPGALLAGRERHIGLGPLPRPEILVAVEAGGAEPVLHGEVEGILDAEPALLRRIDQEQAAERPERLAADRLLTFLVDHDHALAGVGDFGCGHKARQSRTDDDHVRLFSHVSPHRFPCICPD